MSEVKGYLESVRKLIADPEYWTQGAMARDRVGRDVDEVSPDAVCWCLGGAINNVYEDLYHGLTERCNMIIASLTRMKVSEKLSQLAYGYNTDYPMSSLTHFNDTHSHSEVLELLDQAISD